MQRRNIWAAALVAPLVSTLTAAAQDVRHYQDPNTGVTYRETTQTIQRQMPVTQYHDSTRTVLRGQYRTDTQPIVRTYSVPVTEYRWESYWQGRYNPFTQPTIGYRMVPTTRWETHSDVAHVPVTRYETVPTVETVQVPYTTYHTVHDQVVHRQALAPPVAGSSVIASAPFPSPTIGGVARLDNPPSQGGSSDSTPSPGSRTAMAK
jgi:hypothetical protein